jgi:hypothetical protein
MKLRPIHDEEDLIMSPIFNLDAKDSLERTRVMVFRCCRWWLSLRRFSYGFRPLFPTFHVYASTPIFNVQNLIVMPISLLKAKVMLCWFEDLFKALELQNIQQYYKALVFIL